MSAPQPCFWNKVWNEPRHFFAGLTLLALLVMAASLIAAMLDLFPQYPSDRLRHALLWGATILIVTFIIASGCMVLAFIPPIRRLLAWLLQRRWYALACLVTLVALFYAEENWRGKRAWDNYRRESAARGEPLDYESIIPPPVPDDQNFATTPIVASTYAMGMGIHGDTFEPRHTNAVDRLDFKLYHEPYDSHQASNAAIGSWQTAVFTDLKPWQEYYRTPPLDPKTQRPLTNDFPTMPAPGNAADDVLLALSRYDAPLAELREAATLPHSRFPIRYQTELPFEIVLPHLSKNKPVANFLQLRTIAELQAGKAGEAFDDVLLALRWMDAIRNEPFLIDGLVRIADLHIVLQPIWEGLAAKKWSDDELARLQDRLAKEDYMADYPYGLRGERACGIRSVEYVRRTRKLDQVTAYIYDSRRQDNPALAALASVGWFIIPDGWFYHYEQMSAEAYQQVLLAADDRVVRSQAEVQQSRQSLNRQLAGWSFGKVLMRLLLPVLENYDRKFVVAQAQLDMALTACALERYHLAHGEYPATLESLAPKFIGKVPHDVINGQPLRYRLTGDDLFVLYSVGFNETDDGGTFVFQSEARRAVNLDKGDWVWRYPAK